MRPRAIPKLIVERTPDVSVTFSNIRWGDIGSTFSASSTAGVDGGVGAYPGGGQLQAAR